MKWNFCKFTKLMNKYDFNLLYHCAPLAFHYLYIWLWLSVSLHQPIWVSRLKNARWLQDMILKDFLQQLLLWFLLEYFLHLEDDMKEWTKEENWVFLLLSLWQGNNLDFFSCFGIFFSSSSLSDTIFLFSVQFFFNKIPSAITSAGITMWNSLFFYAKALHFVTFFFSFSSFLVTFKNIKIIWEDWDALKRQKRRCFFFHPKLVLFLMLFF